MAMSTGGGGAGVAVHAERDADDRRHAGAADHLHGGHAGTVGGIQRDPPQAQNIKDHPEDDQTDQVLGIDKDGNYYLNKKQIRSEDVAAALKHIYVDTPRDDNIMYLKADKNLDYGKVLDAIDIAMHNGVRVVGMISDQKPGTMSTVAGDTKRQCRRRRRRRLHREEPSNVDDPRWRRRRLDRRCCPTRSTSRR